MPLIKFNWVDIVFVTLLFRSSYIGLKSGLLGSFLHLLGLVSAFLVSFSSYTLLTTFLTRYTKWSGAKPDVISFLVIFLAVLLIFKLISVFIRMFLSGENVSGSSRIIGGIVGFARGILLVSLIYNLFVNSPFEYLSRSSEQRSFLKKYVSGIAPAVYKCGIYFYPYRKVKTPLVRLLK